MPGLVNATPGRGPLGARQSQLQTAGKTAMHWLVGPKGRSMLEPWERTGDGRMIKEGQLSESQVRYSIPPRFFDFVWAARQRASILPPPTAFADAIACSRFRRRHRCREAITGPLSASKNIVKAEDSQLWPATARRQKTRECLNDVNIRWRPSVGFFWGQRSTLHSMALLAVAEASILSFRQPGAAKTTLLPAASTYTGDHQRVGFAWIGWRHCAFRQGSARN